MKKSIKILNESIQDIKKLVWPNLSIHDVVRFMKFSPSWEPSLENIEIETELSSELYEALISELDSLYKENQISNRKQYIDITPINLNTNLNNIKLTGDKKLIDGLKIVAANIKLDKILQKVSDEEILVNGTKEQQIQIFSLFNVMKNDINTADELINLSNSVINLMQQMKDKSLSPDDKKTVITNMKQTGSNLKTKLDTIIKTELTQDEQTEFDKLIPSTNNSVSKYKITGFYQCVVFIFDLITSINNNNKFEIEDVHWAVRSENAEVCRILQQPSTVSPFTINQCAFLHNETLSKFNEKAKLISDADEQTRYIIKICNNELTRSLPQNREALIKNIEFEEQKLRKDLSQEERIATETALAKYRSELDLQVFNTPEELELYLKWNNIGFLTRLYNKKLFEGRAKIKEIVTNIKTQKSKQEELAKKETELLNTKDNDEKKQIRIVINTIRNELTELSEKIPTDSDGNINFDEESERKKLPTDLMSFKTLFSLKNTFDNFLKKNFETHITPQSDPYLKTNCARRRMKLFAAAERRGATVYKCKDWVLAALPTAKAAQPFGRYRPKVDEQGRIKEECNLETWEGITPENKKIRDSKNYPYIKDGLNNECIETHWCTSGWGYIDKRQWDNEVGPDNMFGRSYSNLGALIAFMDCSTGYLYQYGNGELLSETDYKVELLNGINNMRQLLIKYPSLHDAIESAGFTKYLRPDDKIKSQGLTINELMQSGLMSSSGSVKIKLSDDFNKILPVIDFIDEIVLDKSCDTSYVFRKLRDNNKIVSLPIIDLNNIKTASHLFENITISNETLKLKNTSNITNAISMFKNLKFQTPSSEIVGLDTKNVVNAHEMFAYCRNTQFRNVSIPELDFSNCKYMDNAFTSSGISGIKFKKGTNTDKVVSAIDAFKNCFILENMPNVLFKSIKHGKNLLSNFTGNYASIFDGCNTLIKKYRSQPSTNNKDGDKFDDIIDAIKNFYEDPEQTKLLLDSRGYAIVNSPDDAATIAPLLSRRDIKGIVIGKNADTYCLFDSLELNIKSLDINGHSSTGRMFVNCEIHEFNEIIGTENLVDATEMFYSTKCNIYPKINLPKCNNFNIFANARSPRTIPEIEYGNYITEIKGAEFNLIQNGIPPTDDGRKIAYNICNNMFDNTDSAWIKDHDLIRLANSLYIEHIRKINENILESLQKDDRDYYIINESFTQGLILTLINSGSVAGFVFDSEYVKKLNSKNGSPALLFSKISVNYMPIIDFNGLQNCSEMFYQSKITRFEGFEHTDSIINASYMFDQIETQQVFPIFNSKNLKFADYMFYGAKLNNGFSSKFDFSNLVAGQSMFFQLQTSNLPFENNLNLPNVENANNMFYNSNTKIVTNINIDTINMPKCKTAKEMFYLCSKIISIKTINIGQNTSDVNLYALFLQCSNLIKISNINIPTAINCNTMFYNCTSLKNIGQFNAPRCMNLENAFFKCAVLSSICMINVPSTARGTSIFEESKLQYVYGRDGKALFARMALLGK